MEVIRLILLLTSGLAVPAERYRYGSALSPRDRSSHERDVTVIPRADVGFPRAGAVTSWSVYANGTGNATLQVWRAGANHTGRFSLVGANRLDVAGGGLFTFEIYDDRIRIEVGDVIGFRADDGAVLPYSVPTAGCPPSAAVWTSGDKPAVGQTYDFHGVTADACRIYSIQAEVEITGSATTAELQTSGSGSETSTADIQAVTSSRQETPSTSSAPPQEGLLSEQTTSNVVTGDSRQDIDVMLLNGRQPREGIVLVRSGRGAWNTICDEGWQDASAGVLCRMLGYAGGAAKYSPYFGHLSEDYRELAPLQCEGDERTLAQCRGWRDGTTNKCRMGDAAAVQCFAQNTDVRHVFGYPAVERKHLDAEGGARVIIPHSHQTLPWTSGTIRQWAFYAAVDVTNASALSFQVWRRFDRAQYVFVGEAAVGEASPGFHVRELTGSDDRLHFEAGDVLGIRFAGVNPVPYDVHPGPCEAQETLHVMHPTSELLPGQPYHFQSTPSNDEGCKMYSMFVSYVGSERFGSHIFSIDHSLYKVILYASLSWDEADEACARELGDRSRLVDVDSESEYSGVVGMLNSMDISDDLWIGGRPASDAGEVYRKWAQCHPRKGQRCTYLGHAAVDEFYSYSTDVFYMFTDTCEKRKHFICEKTPYSVVVHGDVLTSRTSNNRVSAVEAQPNHNVTAPEARQPKIIISHKVNDREAPSILVAPVTTAVLLFTCLTVFIIFHLYRRQRRKHSRDDEISESTVRFISLYDKAALNSMDC